MDIELANIAQKRGYLPLQYLREIARRNFVYSGYTIKDWQLQPASLDLRIGEKGYRVRSAFLPDRDSVLIKLNQLKMYEVDLRDGAILEKGGVYLIPLLEQLNLPDGIGGKTNPKSSIGRLDVFTRVVTDYNHRFDEIKPGYKGKLFLQVISRSFTIRVKTGFSFNQLRLFTQDIELSDQDLKKIYRETPLLYDARDNQLPVDKVIIDDGLFISVGLSNGSQDIIAYKAKKNSDILDLSRITKYEVLDFWEPISENNNRPLILEPEEFYIMASKEKIRIPLKYVGEMVAYEPNSGELRSHYAGFFDPGFGYGPKGELHGTRSILEVRPHDVPFMVEDGQTFCKLRFNKIISPPEVAYGDTNLDSHYQFQGLTVSKYFRQEIKLAKTTKTTFKEENTLPLFDNKKRGNI